MFQGKVDTRKLKSSLTLKDYEAILKALGIPVFAKGQKYWSLWTGCHNKDPLQGSPKLLFYPDSGVFQCLTHCACNRDIIGLTQARLALLSQPSSFMDAINFILSATGKSTESVQRISKPNVYDWESQFEKFVRFKRTGSSLPVYDKAILDQLDKSLPVEWINQGISVETMLKYQIGYYARSNSTTIPVFDKQGNLCGIRTRNWNPEDIERAKYIPMTLLDGTCYKFDTNQLLYGINWNWPSIEASKQVFICEGEKGVLKLDTWFGNKSCAVAMFGSSLGIKRRNDLIQLGVNDVVIVADCDFIGGNEQDFKDWQHKIQRQVDLWTGYAQVSVMWDDGKLLGPKDNATDKGVDIWNKMYEEREIVK